MSLEEKAEEYATESGYTKGSPDFWIVTQGYLAGAKENGVVWHDINDTEPSKEQLGKQLLIRMESVIGDTDYDYLVYKYSGESITDVHGVIAWCEIKE